MLDERFRLRFDPDALWRPRSRNESICYLVTNRPRRFPRNRFLFIANLAVPASAADLVPSARLEAMGEVWRCLGRLCRTVVP